MLLPFLHAGSPSTACPTLCTCPAVLGSSGTVAEAQLSALLWHSPARPARLQSCHRLSPLCPSGQRWLQGWGAWQHPLEPSPAPSLINAYRAFILIVLRCFLPAPNTYVGIQHLSPSSQGYRGLQPTTGDGEGCSNLDLRGGLGLPGRKGLRTVPAVPGPGCESQGPTRRRCQLTLGRGRRTWSRPNPVLSHFHSAAAAKSAQSCSCRPLRAVPAHPAALPGMDGATPGCAAEPASRGVRLGASHRQLCAAPAGFSLRNRALAAPDPSPRLPEPARARRAVPRRQRPVPRLVQAAFPCAKLGPCPASSSRPLLTGAFTGRQSQFPKRPSPTLTLLL